MKYQDNLNNLLKMIRYNENENKITLKFNDEYRLFPFQTRKPNRPKFDSGFKHIVSEIARIVCSVDLEKNFNYDILLNEVLSNEHITVDDGSDKKQLNLLLHDYLINHDDDLNIIHPYLYKYVLPTSGPSNKGEKDVALFFRDVFFNDFSEIENYFMASDNEEYTTNNILVDLVIENIPELNEKRYEKTYISKLDYVTDVFRDDIQFALEHREFLDKNIENIFSYYYFFYITQLNLKIFSQENTLDSCEELYYLLDSENASMKRKSINNGYNLIKTNNRSLLYKVYTIDYVNKLLGTVGLTRSELINHVYNLDDEEYDEFMTSFKEFIRIYNKTHDSYEEITENDFDELFKYLHKQFIEKISDQSPNSRYSLYYEDIGKKYFLKKRGQYGYVLNISQSMLLTITALCVKDDKMKLKDLFKEYEKRGLFFDKTSKFAVEELLTKLNYIDKKSDSGEVQYVRKFL